MKSYVSTHHYSANTSFVELPSLTVGSRVSWKWLTHCFPAASFYSRALSKLLAHLFTVASNCFPGPPRAPLELLSYCLQLLLVSIQYMPWPSLWTVQWAHGWAMMASRYRNMLGRRNCIVKISFNVYVFLSVWLFLKIEISHLSSFCYHLFNSSRNNIDNQWLCNLVFTNQWPGSGDYFHLLHHAHFDCNYGAMHVPLDYLFGTYAGSKAEVIQLI